MNNNHEANSRQEDDEDDSAFNIKQFVIKVHVICIEDTTGDEGQRIINESVNLNYDMHAYESSCLNVDANYTKVSTLYHMTSLCMPV